MKAAEIRQRILDEHVELREMLADLERLADRFGPPGADVADELREGGLALYAKLSAHLDVEDDMLVPALRAGGPVGRRRAEQLVAEHREQRELLEFLIGRLTSKGRPTVLIASELRNFIEYVREDMEDEEATLLTREILGDVSYGETAAAP